MRTVCSLNKCNGCMACIDRCPKHCICIVDNISSYNAVIDENQCINCKLCDCMCPNITTISKNKPIDWVQGWAEKSTREISSSGGAASAIIKSFISSGGYVASCLFVDGQFLFDITNDLETAKRFAGSKYVKSNPKGIYKKIEKRIKTDKVLFIGLPCQVAALKNYLSNEEKLFTIDLICHGTPSPQLLDIYLEEEGYNLKEIRDIKFRLKAQMGLCIDNHFIPLKRITNEYLISFLNSVDYTENCYSCNYASLDRVSDVTLGDSWGSELHDELKNGVSLILVQSDKGNDLIHNAYLELKDVDLENAVRNNHQLSHPSVRTPKRDKFLKMVKDGKRFKSATLATFPKIVIKQKLKYALIKLHLMKVGG